MRNCYVYACDRKHKDDPKRAMFNVPKDPEKFEDWRLALPIHRPLRPHDRVCEKHFRPEDIQRDWSYQIQGQTRKLMRSKPVLMPDAVPCFFDTVKTLHKKEAKQSRRKKIQQPSEESNLLVVVESQQDEPICVEQTSMVVLIEDNSMDDAIKQLAPSISKEVELLETEPDAATKESIFEELYDNIYEVELPSTLWGVHREPDRKFAAFSRFEWCQSDGNVVKSVSLLIDCSLACRAWYSGKIVLERNISLKLAPKPDDEEKKVRFNVIMDLLDKLEQTVTETKGSVGVENITKSLEMCIKSESPISTSDKK
uniref:THAP-type domain-containing protein n=1 Tax=Anopheles christyi TaxID=43041 RepID=A0A182KFE7_9DIPT